MKMIEASSPPTDDNIATARSYKRIIYNALLKTVDDGRVQRENAGVLVDEWLGKEVLLDANKAGFITCTPLEKSGQDEFDFDREDWKKQIEELNPTYVKVLVRYNPKGDSEMNTRQSKRLATLSKHLEEKENGYLFELLVPATDDQLQEAGSQEAYDQNVRPELMVKAIEELYAAGVTPDVWKIEGLDTTEAMEKVGKAVSQGNSDAGIIILGRGESAEKAKKWLQVGAHVSNAVGFAVGRTIFKAPLEQLHAGKIDESAATEQIADNYASFVKVWEDSRG